MSSSSTFTTSRSAAAPADSAPCLQGCAQGARGTASSTQGLTLVSYTSIPAATSICGLEQMAHIQGRLSTRFRRSRIRRARRAIHRAMTCPYLGRIFHHQSERLQRHRFCCSAGAMLERPTVCLASILRAGFRWRYTPNHPIWNSFSRCSG